MSVPYKCPKCDGVGFLRYNPNNPFADYAGTSTACFGQWSCNACVNGIIWGSSPPTFGGVTEDIGNPYDIGQGDAVTLK